MLIPLHECLYRLLGSPLPGLFLFTEIKSHRMFTVGKRTGEVLDQLPSADKLPTDVYTGRLSLRG